MIKFNVLSAHETVDEDNWSGKVKTQYKMAYKQYGTHMSAYYTIHNTHAHTKYSTGGDSKA